MKPLRRGIGFAQNLSFQFRADAKDRAAGLEACGAVVNVSGGIEAAATGLLGRGLELLLSLVQLASQSAQDGRVHLAYPAL
jgi:hypothetical protein